MARRISPCTRANISGNFSMVSKQASTAPRNSAPKPARSSAARSPAHFDIVSRRGGSVSVFGSIAVSTPSRYETSAFSASTP